MRSPVSFVFLLLPALLLAGCTSGLPDPESVDYRDTVAAFYTGVAAVQSGSDVGVTERFLTVTTLAPGEPAAWANLGLVALRQNDLAAAATYLNEARRLAPEDSRILFLIAALERAQGNDAAARATLESALEVQPGDVQVRFALLQLLDEQGATDEARAVHLEALQAALPGNLALLVRRAQDAASTGDPAELEAALEQMEPFLSDWSEASRDQYGSVREAPLGSAAQQTALTVLQNVLLREPGYRESLAVLQPAPEQVADIIPQFMRLTNPRSRVSPPDDSLAFFAEPILGLADTWDHLDVLFLRDEGAPDLILARADSLVIGREGRIGFPGGNQAAPAHGIVGLDYDYDFQMDLAVAGMGGLRLVAQDSLGRFADVTASLGLSVATREAAYTGIWAADIDMEGDMDLVLARAEEPPVVLQNRGDGTFAIQPFMAEIASLRVLDWADLDHDSDPDLAAIDAEGRLVVWANLRNGRYAPVAVPDPGPVAQLQIADLDADGFNELVVWDQAGTIHVLYTDDGTRWDAQPLADGAPRAAAGGGFLFINDIDNNGSFDLLASADQQWKLWLSDGDGGFPVQLAGNEMTVHDIAEMTGDGRLDLVGIDAAGRVGNLVNVGVKPYQWKRLRLRAATVLGDQRINAFGIGGSVELRAGLLYQKQIIREPVVHFGLGDDLVADMARIVWPNGSVQAEFDLLSDQVVSAQQRLKGSCPWLFTYDGNGMAFVTDFIWRSPLGLAINAQETAGVMATEDWVRIRGDQLVPRDGMYDVRITAELWETHFFDHVALRAVDYPDTLAFFLDERFVMPPPEHRVHLMTSPQPVAQVVTDAGEDVTSLVADQDARYLDFAGRGRYQGITRDHAIEIDLGIVPADAPLVLIAHGWIRPTDSSINVAISQGQQAAPKGLRVDVPDGRGGWRVLHPNYGFPSGKLKSVLVDLTDAFAEPADARVRLSTNLEIYWDHLQWATQVSPDLAQVTKAPMASAELRYRGFGRVTEANRSSPELPSYDDLVATQPIWLDLEGYYTRFGDVSELLERVEDRYVIMNAGDEMRLAFEALPPPPEGWTRDFVLVGDGWVKDGDYNTTFSTTVLPLPAHAQPDYTIPPTTLEGDPVYQRHASDWQTYHTRYVTPRPFLTALRPNAAPGD